MPKEGNAEGPAVNTSYAEHPANGKYLLIYSSKLQLADMITKSETTQNVRYINACSNELHVDSMSILYVEGQDS